ncbi:monofunctional biosynthetic peptidoglycan transglycosylase [Oligoflexus tunisiensis]|uniref:monofunctional biosynthetic peptidoglycan transglycosylase n=1 Tax=Oligoflexus tunisiensis TaxID=708132 RepID=UPI000AFD468C|nr:monofunctional biosynthetic peptidoglycan transglycosylase [Oligoflexus tunisiensis]
MTEETPAPVTETEEKPSRFSWLKSITWSWRRALLGLLAGVLLFEGIALIVIWPDWDALRQGKVPESALIKDYIEQRAENPKLPRLQWTPLQKPLPQRVKKAFILSEDSRFYEHGGVDFQAIRDAIDYNWRHGKVVLGASTISQQTAKNMFLSLSRNPLRKFHELFLTWLLEYKLSKAEILHIYLNVAEFGLGIYGIEAASRHYYHTSAYNLTTAQAAELAASLPSPKKHNPRTRTRFFTRHVARLSRTLQIVDQYAAEQGQKPAAETPLVSDELAKKLQELRELNDEDGETVETPLFPTDTTVEETQDETPEDTGDVTAGTPIVEEPLVPDTPTPEPTPDPTLTATPTPTPDAEPLEEDFQIPLE